ncbi:RNHCP domain protein, partial [Clostridioides difficile 6057]
MNYKNRKRAYYQENSCMDNFICKNCGCLVVPEGAGTQHRNHCPHCLHSLHVDIIPGDRAADCDANMEPIGVWVRKNGEWAIIHRCTRCGHLSSNRIAADDNSVKLMSIALK